MRNGDTKYIKTSRHVLHHPSFLWTLLLPAAATVTTDIWIHTFTLSFNYNLVLAVVNVSGAFLDGFFSVFETGDVAHNGPKTKAIHLVSMEIRAFGLSTYTSWAGMVNAASSIGFAKSNVFVGLVYILLCIGCGFAAHGLGSDLAKHMSDPVSLPGTTTYAQHNPVPRALKILDVSMISLTIYILVSYLYLQMTEPHQKFWTDVTPCNQLIVSIFFAVGGAYTGNIVSNLAPKSTNVQLGTIMCNVTFSLLSLSLNVFRAKNPLWDESLVLKACSVNFCGAASVFSRHISGLSLLYSTSSKRSRLVLMNVFVNLLFATMIYWIALEIEILLHETDYNLPSPAFKPVELANS